MGGLTRQKKKKHTAEEKAAPSSGTLINMKQELTKSISSAGRAYYVYDVFVLKAVNEKRSGVISS